MKLVYVIPSLGAGGAERALVLLAEEFASWGWQVEVISFSAVSEDFYTLSPGIRRHGLDVSRNRVGNFLVRSRKRISLLKPLIAKLKPDVVVAYTPVPSILTLLACRGTDLPVICMEQIDPRPAPLSFVMERLRFALYPKATAIVLPAERVRPWAATFIPLENTFVIPNPARVLADCVPERLPGSRKRLLTVGRLTAQKGFDMLLMAFSRLAPQFPDWTLTIVGEGEDRDKLVAQARELKISDQVEMLGRLKEPDAVFRGSDLYVLSSRYEGFPLSLLEAMGCGLPCVAFDCPTGPSEIIEHESTGLLVPNSDVQALTDALARMMSSPETRASFGLAATGVYRRYGTTQISKLWLDLFVKLGLVQVK